MKIQLRELAQTTSSTRVDEQSGVISGVKLLGAVSDNDRTYSREAMARAVQAGLYEGVPVYLGHRKSPSEDREGFKIGWIENSRLARGGDAIFGNVRLLTKHPMVPPILQAAALNPRLFGMSHDAEGDADENGKKVTAIVGVESCDVVDRPATTKGFFESQSRQQRGTTVGKKKRFKETDATPFADDPYTMGSTPGASGGDDFTSAVAALQRCLDGAGTRHDQKWKDDVQEALELLTAWLDEEDPDAGNNGDPTGQESRRGAPQGSLRETYRPGAASADDAKARQQRVRNMRFGR